MRLSAKLARPGAQERLACRTPWKLRIEATFRVEANLAWEDRAVMETPSRPERGSVEVRCIPSEAQRIVGVARTHRPPVRTEADYADVHAVNSAVSIPKAARVWAIRSGPRR